SLRELQWSPSPASRGRKGEAFSRRGRARAVSTRPDFGQRQETNCSPKATGAERREALGRFRATQSASPPSALRARHSPLRISPAAEGDAEGGAPPGAPPRRLLFARRRPCCRCRDRLAKRPSPRKVLRMWFRQGLLSIGKGRYRDGRTRARRVDHPVGAAGGCGVRLRARSNLAADIPDIAAGRR